MYDPMVQSHRELRAALYLAGRELKKSTTTPRRGRLLMIMGRTLFQAKQTAVACGVSKIPKKAS
jgi:hypothetical protein